MLWWNAYQLMSGDWRAAKALANSKDPRAARPLIAALKRKYLRHAATEALVELGSVAVGPLAAALKHADIHVRLAAAGALERLGRKPADDAERALQLLVDRVEDSFWWKRLGASAVEPLISALKHTDHSVKMVAINALRALRDSRGAEPLMTVLLYDESDEVRRAAAASLAALLQDENENTRAGTKVALSRRFAPVVRFGGKLTLDRRVVMSFAAALRDRRCKGRRYVPLLLEKFDDPIATGALVVALKDEDYLVRSHAARCLMKLPRWRPADDGERALAAVAMGDWPSVVSCGVAAVEPLLVALRDASSPHFCWRAEEAAAYTNWLVALAEALGQIGGARAVEPLASALRSSVLLKSDRRALEALVRSLGETKDVRAIDPLIAELMREGGAQMEARRALVCVGNPAVESLAVVLRHTPGKPRILAAEALAEIGKGGRDLLVAELIGKDTNYSVRKAAAHGLAKSGWRPESLVERAWYAVAFIPLEWTPKLPIEELASLGEAAVEPLIQVLRKSDGAKLILWDVVHTLALIKGERAVEVLLETLTHPEYLARAAAREELARIGETRAIKPLLEVLAHDIELFEREGAARSLEALGWEPATGTERALRAIALGQWDAVVNIGAEAVPPVLPLLESTKRPLDEPLQALGRIGDTRALGPIMKWVMVNPDYAQCAVEVVSQILKKKPGGAAAGDLRQIARMRDPVQNEYRWCPSPDDIPWREVSGQHRVDCTELRRLALRELGAA